MFDLTGEFYKGPINNMFVYLGSGTKEEVVYCHCQGFSKMFFWHGFIL